MYKIVDASERHRKHSNTFKIPSKSALQNISTGQHVKIIFEDHNGAERLWMLITEIDGDKITASVNDNPVVINGLHHGDSVQFGRNAICSILDNAVVV